MLALRTLAFRNAVAPCIANVAVFTKTVTLFVENGGSGEIRFAKYVGSAKSNYRCFEPTAMVALGRFPRTHCDKTAEQKQRPSAVHSNELVKL